jgi:hypothetical protein
MFQKLEVSVLWWVAEDILLGPSEGAILNQSMENMCKYNFS